MAEVDARFVKQGFWLNQEAGPVMGQTLTVESETGTFIVATLAVLCSLAMTHLWNLVSFAYHQARANGQPSDGLFWQQQALLRSLTPPDSFAADSLKLWWLWRNKVQNPLMRTIPQFLVAVLFSVATIAVGVLSSSVVTNGNSQILVRNPQCGPLKPDLTNYTTTTSVLLKYSADIESRSKPFAEECYRNTTSLPARCRVYVKPNVALKPERVDCPFDSKICMDHERPGISIDSGLIDGNEAFGLNLGSRDRVKMRRKVTCGLLRTEGYTSIMDASDYPDTVRPDLPGEKIYLSQYGMIREPNGWANYILALSSATANVSRSYTTAIKSYFLFPEWGSSSYLKLVPELESNDADMVLLMIAKNLVRYTNPVNDPFFAAHRPFMSARDSQGDKPFYFSDWPNSHMGCRQQYQYCFVQGNGSDFCSPLTGLVGSIRSEDFPGASEIQLAAVQLFWTANLMYDTSSALGRVLKAEDLLLDRASGLGLGLPDDQWAQEVIGWENYVWAAYQSLITDYAVGHSARDPSIQEIMKQDLTTGEKQLCGVQRMRKSGGFMNLNVFGFAFIIAVACTVTITDLVLLKFLIYLRRFRLALAPRICRWVQDGVFQLQRRAFEARGEGSWIHTEKEIPATLEPSQLQELPVESMLPAGECKSCRDRNTAFGLSPTSTTLTRPNTDDSDIRKH